MRCLTNTNRGSHICLGAKIPCMYAIYNINMVISVQVQRGTYYEQVSSDD